MVRGPARGPLIPRSIRCVDSLLINGRGQRICPPVPFMESFAPPTVLPLTNKGCIFPNSTVIMGPQPNYTAQYPDQANPLTFFGCDNTTNVSPLYDVDTLSPIRVPIAFDSHRGQSKPRLCFRQCDSHRWTGRAEDRHRRAQVHHIRHRWSVRRTARGGYSGRPCRSKM